LLLLFRPLKLSSRAFLSGVQKGNEEKKSNAIHKFPKSVLLFKSGTTSITWALKAASSIKVKLQSTIPMVVLCFLHEDDDSAAAIRVEELNQANLVDETITEFQFENYCFDEDIIVHAVIDLFHRAFQKGRQLDYLQIAYCTGRIDDILHAASSFDMFDKISLQGVSEISHRGFRSMSSAMKSNKRLTKLELKYMEMTKQQAAALGVGLVTSNSQNHFKELHMACVEFTDGAITEFVSGLRQNSSLCRLHVGGCDIGDAGLAELVGAVESHPSLKELELWGNGGRKQAWVALGKLLASKSCQLEKLDFAFQDQGESTAMIFADGAITEFAFGLKQNSSLCILNVHLCDLGDTQLAELVGAVESHPTLTELSLGGNGGQKHAWVALGKVLASRSCRLEELDFSNWSVDNDWELTAMRFADGSITELVSGLKHNTSLRILNVDGCDIRDAELAELVGALESHPSLKQLELGRNAGHKHALVALGKVLASRSCQLEVLDFSDQCTADNADDGLTGHLGLLVQGFLQGTKSLTHLTLSCNGLLDKDIDHLGQILSICKLQNLDLSANRFTHIGFVILTQNIPKSLRSFDFSENHFDKDDVACHTLKLFEEYPQLFEDGFDWDDSESPIHRKIQHFKDLNRCGRILLALERGAMIPLSVWPLVLAQANILLSGNKERTHNAIFHLLQGPALMQRRFDRDSISQGTCIGASEQLTTSSKRGPAETIDRESAKKGRSES
jgi:hypothetical protein